MAVRFSQRCRAVSRRWRWWSRRQSLPRPSRPSACPRGAQQHAPSSPRPGPPPARRRRAPRTWRPPRAPPWKEGGGGAAVRRRRSPALELPARRPRRPLGPTAGRAARGRGEARGGDAGAPAWARRRPTPRPARALSAGGARAPLEVEVDFSWFGLVWFGQPGVDFCWAKVVGRGAEAPGLPQGGRDPGAHGHRLVRRGPLPAQDPGGHPLQHPRPNQSQTALLELGFCTRWWWNPRGSPSP